MTKPTTKQRLLLSGNKQLGSIVYFKDKKGRGCLKVSFKYKIFDSVLWRTENKTDKKTPVARDPDGVSGDISYKFDDSVLELKREISGEKVKPEFSNVPMPPWRPIFSIILKDWQDLPNSEPTDSTIYLETPYDAKKIIVFFSFPGVDGNPTIPQEYLNQPIKGFVLDLPHKAPRNKMFIGVAKYIENESDNNNIPYNFLIDIPQYKE